MKERENFKATCDECGCEFTFEQGDCHEDVQNFKWCRSALIPYVVRCPKCGNEVWVGDELDWVGMIWRIKNEDE